MQADLHYYFLPVSNFWLTGELVDKDEQRKLKLLRKKNIILVM